MPLINRISRLFRADLHAVLDQIEEPEQLLKQAIRDMEDELGELEQQMALRAQDITALAARRREIGETMSRYDTELDLCFESENEELAKNLIRRKLEAERIGNRLAAQQAADEDCLEQQRARFDDNKAALESLRQKAELVARRRPADSKGRSEFDDIAWMTRELTIGDSDVEIAFLREKSLRSAS